MDASFLELPVYVPSGSRCPAALCVSGHAWRSAAGLHDAEDRQQKQETLVTAPAVLIRRSRGPWRRRGHDRTRRLFVAASASVIVVCAAVIIATAVVFASASMIAAAVAFASASIAAPVCTASIIAAYAAAVSVVAASIAAASTVAIAAE